MNLIKFASILGLAFMVFSCAPQLPQKDVDAAKTSFDAANAAGANVYAPDAFSTATKANDDLQANLTSKDYSKTTELAKAVVDASDAAKAAAEAGKETFKKDVAQLTTDTAALTDTVTKEIAKLTPKAAKKAKIDDKDLKAKFDEATKAVADAKAAADAGNFADAKTKYSTSKDSLTTIQKTLEDAGIKA